ncbi:hypothetical protein PVAND_001034 [Polypedilum vanderplanki]|uniref:Uncharacterized protein n=1 Tax=Polypedilum vanderplanki TaxID=319348 RepID=A0A9J6BMY8_POLVA|nr:hypothetical protein PVAND_001034 [Polypedilum vanderplanki]
MSVLIAKIFSDCIFIESQIVANKSVNIKWRLQDSNSSSFVSPRKIIFRNCTFFEFPQVMKGCNINSLKTLEIVSCQFKEFEKVNFKYFFFKELYIIDCELETLNGDFFKNMRHVVKISFAGNKLKQIGPELLDGLNQLDWVDFRYNSKINMLFDAQNRNNSNTLNEIKACLKSINSKH